MKTSIRLIALVALAAAQFPFLQADVAVGDAFVLSMGEDKADEQARTVEYLTVTNKFASISEDQTGFDATDNAPKPSDLLGAAAQATQPPPVPLAKRNTSEKIDCRVLQACEYGAVNDVVQLTKSELKDAKAQGLVDDDKASVAYAQSLKT